MNLIPISDWVMIDRAISRNITDGGIILPTETGRTKPEHGVVIACGRGIKTPTGRMPMQVKLGDTVVFRRFDVEKIKGIKELENDKGRPYIFIRDRDLWAILDIEQTTKIKSRMVG